MRQPRLGMSARIRIFYLEVLPVRNLQNDTEVFCIKRPPHFGVFHAAVHFTYDK